MKCNDEHFCCSPNKKRVVLHCGSVLWMHDAEKCFCAKIVSPFRSFFFLSPILGSFCLIHTYSHILVFVQYVFGQQEPGRDPFQMFLSRKKGPSLSMLPIVRFSSVACVKTTLGTKRLNILSKVCFSDPQNVACQVQDKNSHLSRLLLLFKILPIRNGLFWHVLATSAIWLTLTRADEDFCYLSPARLKILLCVRIVLAPNKTTQTVGSWRIKSNAQLSPNITQLVVFDQRYSLSFFVSNCQFFELCNSNSRARTETLDY